jgi:hypothetical protein
MPGDSPNDRRERPESASSVCPDASYASSVQTRQVVATLGSLVVLASGVGVVTSPFRVLIQPEPRVWGRCRPPFVAAWGAIDRDQPLQLWAVTEGHDFMGYRAVENPAGRCVSVARRRLAFGFAAILAGVIGLRAATR